MQRLAAMTIFVLGVICGAAILAMLCPQASGQSSSGTASPSAAPGITEDQIRQMLVGKTVYLRGGYLDNSLNFDEHGRLSSHSPQGSYTLNLIQIDRMHVSKHKVEFEGERYALHFLGAMPYEDPTKAVDKVRISPKKKIVHISIDREEVIIPKKSKVKKQSKGSAPQNSAHAAEAATPAEKTPLGPGVPNSPAHAAKVLQDALDKVFAQNVDDRMIAAMPDFWKLYYQAVASKTDFKPADPGILSQTSVDQKAKLLTTIDPPSNEYAQANGVAGMALYHAVVGTDGKVEEVAVARPVGFGLDENAVNTIRNASFQPAVKDGKPVPVLLDLVVLFRIYSKRTMETTQEAAQKPAAPVLPGPYSVQTP
jgi:TonB family protein